MALRLLKAQFDYQKGDQNKMAMKDIIKKGRVPGVMAYYKTEPIGWCSIEPREYFPRLALARTLKPIDDKPVWSITCLFIAKDYRKQNIAVDLVKAAVKYAKTQKANIVEAYPYDLTDNEKPLPDPFVWTGLVQIFIKAGFKEAVRFSKTRPIMRKYI
ncbi:MAG: GNAT family N-acetyltransferase [bacterium]